MNKNVEIKKKYFVVGLPKEQYYPYVLGDDDTLLFDSIEDAKKAIADERYKEQPGSLDDFWIGEKIEYDLDEIQSMRKTWDE